MRERDTQPETTMLTLILLATGPILAAMAAYSLLTAIAGDDEGDDLDDAAE